MLVLDTILHHRSPELMKVMRAKYDPKRYDYVRDADELMHITKLIELGSRLVGHEVVTAHVDKAPTHASVFQLRQEGSSRVRLQEKVVFDDETSNTSGRGYIVLTLTIKSSEARTKGAKRKKKAESRG